MGGCAAYLPTDGTNVPDFMVSSGELVPEMNCSMACAARADSAIYRDSNLQRRGPIPLAELVRTALEICGAAAIGMAMVVESAGLVGAALRRSPAAAAGLHNAPFNYSGGPDLAVVLPERMYSRSLAVISGIAAASNARPWLPMLRRSDRRPRRRDISMPLRFLIARSRRETSI